jgi:hypothetical protein
LRACGREWITVHTLPFFSIRTVMMPPFQKPAFARS